jgi:hypothetical protein
MSKYIVIGVGCIECNEDSYLLGVTDDFEEAVKIAQGPTTFTINNKKIKYTEAAVFEIGKMEEISIY